MVNKIIYNKKTELIHKKTELIHKKTELIHMLKNSKGPVSGEHLCQLFHISRVAVWKNIQSLIKMGYTIKATHAGYTLIENKNLLLPWEFPGQEDNIFHYRESSSTMDIARKLAFKGYPEGTTIISETQNRGHGRNRRIWDSKSGGLYFSVIFYPEISAAYIFLYVLAASISLVRTIRAAASLPAAIKWPNDILVDNKKVAGVLIETSGEASYPTFFILGIGVNIHNKVRTAIPGAAALIDLAHQPIFRSSFFIMFQKNFNSILAEIYNPSLLTLYKKLSCTIGKNVHIKYQQRKILHGKAVDISRTGDLIIIDKNGKKHHAFFGDCIHA